jgi:hypothetical protein
MSPCQSVSVVIVISDLADRPHHIRIQPQARASRLELEAQAVLDVIENPDVAQALRQDKNQNLQYLKDNYNVRLQHLHHLFRQHLPIS